MAIKLDSVRSDLKREAEGDWVDIPEWPGVKLKVRGANYGPFLNARSIVIGRFSRRYGREPVPVEEGYKEDAKLYAKYILLGWNHKDGPKEDDGFDEPYSEDRALEILLDPAYRQLHDHIRYAMLKVEQTEVEFVEDAAKNSSRSSAGGSKTATQPVTGSPT